MLGLAIGDALGAPLEFTQQHEHSFEKPLTGPRNDLPPHLRGTTDDTAMAAGLARSLLLCKGLSTKHLVDGYRSWARTAPDVGLQTSRVLHRVSRGEDVERASREVWIETGASGNGALMRIAPLAVFQANSGENHIIRDALAECRLTHWSPLCQLANASYAFVIWTMLTAGRQFRNWELKQLAHAGLELGKQFIECDKSLWDVPAVLLASDIDAASLANPGVYSGAFHLYQTMGFVRIAFRLAFWELFRAPSFEAALTDVVNRGGDADTNGAITGALLGAHYGESKIPERWVRAITADGNQDVQALLDLADAVSE